MFKLIFLTLLCLAFVAVVYDQIKYQLHIRSVKRGVIGQIVPYRTPSNVLQYYRCIVLLWSSFRSLWSK